MRPSHVRSQQPLTRPSQPMCALLGAAALALATACGGGSGPPAPPAGLGAAQTPAPQQVDWNAISQWTEDLRQEFVKHQRSLYMAHKREVEPWFERLVQVPEATRNEAQAALEKLRESMTRIEQHLGGFLNADLTAMPERRHHFLQDRHGLVQATEAARPHFGG